MNTITAKNKKTGEIREFDKSVGGYFSHHIEPISYLEEQFNTEWEVIDEPKCKCGNTLYKGETYEYDSKEYCSAECMNKDITPSSSLEDKKTMNKEDIIKYIEKLFNQELNTKERIDSLLKLSDLEQSIREKLISEQFANSMCEYWYKKGKDEALQEVREKIKKLESDYDAFDTPYEVLEQLLTSLQRNDSK